MKIKHQELEIDEKDPFVHCKLDRKQYALVLTNIVNTYADGFVLAINNEWGTGKTTFVKMWQQHLKNNDFQTIYFNAWENDFDNNPLVAIMSELKTLINSDNKVIFKSVLEKGAILVKNVAPALAKSLIKKYVVDIGDIPIDTVENVTKGATEILEEGIREYTKKKETITEFRKELERFIKKTDSDKPLVFIIDELDRCRPNYAVEVLEQMKHFFSVSGIVFVMSIDKNHLASAVRGFYGSEKINTDEYLRRFIDLEYSIPKPSNKVFCEYLFKYYSIDEFLSSTERQKNSEFRSDAELLLKMAELLFNKSNATLRQQEKIFGQVRLILNSFNSNQYIFPHLLFLLVFIKMMKSDLYKRLESNTLTLQELSDSYADLMPANIKDLYGINLIYIDALLLHFYNNNQDYQNRVKLVETTKEEKLTSLVKSKLEDLTSGVDLASCFNDINRQRHYSDTSLKYLLNRINLTELATIQ